MSVTEVIDHLDNALLGRDDFTELDNEALRRAIAQLSTDAQTPSARALRMLARGKKAAMFEVKRHLAAGRSVYGRKDGKPYVVKPRTK